MARFLQTLGGPLWLEMLLLAGADLRPSEVTRAAFGASRLTAELVENLLAADGQPTDLIYRNVFPQATL